MEKRVFCIFFSDQTVTIPAVPLSSTAKTLLTVLLLWCFHMCYLMTIPQNYSLLNQQFLISPSYSPQQANVNNWTDSSVPRRNSTPPVLEGHRVQANCHVWKKKKKKASHRCLLHFSQTLTQELYTQLLLPLLLSYYRLLQAFYLR